MERTDGDKHDRVHECGEDVFGDDEKEETARCAAGGEDRHDELCESCCDQATNEGVAPNVHGRVCLAPFANVVAKEDLDGEVDKDDEGELLLLEALVEQLQASDSVVGLESDLGDQVDDDERLNVLELQDAPHCLVDFLDAVGVAVAVFALHERQTEGYEEVRPTPECEVAVKLEKTGLRGCAGGTEPFVREVF